jgi:2'-5' RNA ligase
MALSVCLLLDERSDRAVRLLWERLEHDGIRTLLTHTHGRHRPHLTLASLLAYDLDETRSTLVGVGLAPLSPMRLRLEGLGMFRRSRCWLAPVASEPLLGLQCEVAGAVRRTDATLHRNYEPGAWTPHLTLAPRLHLDELPTVARHAFEVLPIDAVLERAVLIDTSTGAVHQIPPALR